MEINGPINWGHKYWNDQNFPNIFYIYLYKWYKGFVVPIDIFFQFFMIYY